MSDEESEHRLAAARWLLGALPADEAARFEEHLEHCAICCEEVARLRAAAEAVPNGVPRLTAPADLEERVMAPVREEAARVRPARRARDTLGRRGLLVAGLAGAAGSGGFLLGASRDDAPRPGDAPDTVRETRPEVRGSGARATLRRYDGGSELVLDDLPEPPAQRVYQLWLRRPGRPLAATNRLFTVSREGRAVVAMPSLRGVRALVVTAEPPTGSESPSAARLVVDLPNR